MDFRQAFTVRRALKAAYENGKKKWLSLWMAGFFIVFSEGSCAPPVAGSSATANPDEAAAALCAGLCLFVFFVLTEALIKPGYLAYLKRRVLDDEPRLGAFFSGMKRFVPFLGFSIIRWLSYGALLTIVLLPAIIVSGLGGPDSRAGTILALLGLGLGAPAFVFLQAAYAFGDLLVCLEGANPNEALKDSFALTKGNWMRLTIFVFTMKVVGLVGYVAFCIGGPLTRAAADLALVDAYLWARTGQEDSDDPEEPPDEEPPSPAVPPPRLGRSARRA